MDRSGESQCTSWATGEPREPEHREAVRLVRQRLHQLLELRAQRVEEVLFSQLQDDDATPPGGSGSAGEPAIQPTAKYRLMRAREREVHNNRIAMMVRVTAVLLSLICMATGEVPVGIFAIVLMMIAHRVDR